MILDVFTFIILPETYNPKKVAKRVDKILMLQKPQWSNMTSQDRGNEPDRRTNTQSR